MALVILLFHNFSLRWTNIVFGIISQSFTAKNLHFLIPTELYGKCNFLFDANSGKNANVLKIIANTLPLHYCNSIPF